MQESVFLEEEDELWFASITAEIQSGHWMTVNDSLAFFLCSYPPRLLQRGPESSHLAQGKHVSHEALCGLRLTQNYLDPNNSGVVSFCILATSS